MLRPGITVLTNPKGDLVSIRRILVAGAAAVLAVAVTAGTAHADSAGITGELNTGGHLVQYATFRTHTFTGPITMNLTDNTSNYTRLGLRDTLGNQFTNTSQWNSLGSQNFVLPDGSTTIAQGKQFALNGRMGSCGVFCDNAWAGTLNY